MIENECEIVKDLIPHYVEKTLSKESNEFIEKHINNCNDCKKVLDTIQDEKIQEKNQEVMENNYEIDYLKKYNWKIGFLKFIISMFIIITIVTGGVILTKYIKLQHDYNYNRNIIVTAYENYEKLKQEENFSFIQHIGELETYRQLSGTAAYKFYYKDEKYKLVCEFENTSGDWTDYGYSTNPGWECIQFCELNGGIGHPMGNQINMDIRENEVCCLKLEDFYNLGKKECASIEVRDGIYQGKECYILRKNNENDEYEEIWIEKDKMFIIREIDNLHGKLNEETYEWSVGDITNEDIMIKDTTKHDNNPRYNKILEKLLSDD